MKGFVLTGKGHIPPSTASVKLPFMSVVVVLEPPAGPDEANRSHSVAALGGLDPKNLICHVAV